MSTWGGGVSANITASRVLTCIKQEGNLVQDNSVADAGSSSQSLTLVSLL